MVIHAALFVAILWNPGRTIAVVLPHARQNDYQPSKLIYIETDSMTLEEPSPPQEKTSMRAIILSPEKHASANTEYASPSSLTETQSSVGASTAGVRDLPAEIPILDAAFSNGDVAETRINDADSAGDKKEFHPFGGSSIAAPASSNGRSIEEKQGGYSGTTFKAGALPGYPRSARSEGREGVVTVRILIGINGKPASTTVTESSGFEDLDAAAVRAVMKWRFSPALKNGKPIESYHDVKLTFHLEQ
jgi:protein TonB